MNRSLLTLAALLLLGCASLARAQSQPDMSRQDAWTDADKKAFLKYLESSQPMPAGQVKTVPGAEPSLEIIRPARYATMDLIGDTMFPVSHSGHLSNTPLELGGRALVGTHLFTWVRAYTGLQYNPLEQGKLGGGTALLNHWQVPAELEFALIPLGQDQTRNVLIRAGASAHYISGEPSGDFSAPVTGFRTTWDLGLGYEYQVPETPWRIHALLEGYRSMYRADGTDFYGLDVSAGAAYTF